MYRMSAIRVVKPFKISLMCWSVKKGVGNPAYAIDGMGWIGCWKVDCFGVASLNVDGGTLSSIASFFMFICAVLFTFIFSIPAFVDC